MSALISTELQARLEHIAAQQNTTIEDLLCGFADEVEEKPFFAKLSHFFDVSVAMISVADLHGNFLYVNPTFCRTLGYSEEELRAQPYVNFVHPDDLDATRDAEITLENGNAVTRFENRYRHKDGHYLHLLWASVTEDVYVYAVAFDITQQKNTERELVDALERNQRILHATFDGFFLRDMDGNLLDVNAAYCEMLGYSREELLQKKIFELEMHVSKEEIEENSRLLNQGGQHIHVESQHAHKDGRAVDVELNLSTMGQNRIGGFVRDITERKQLLRDLQHSEQLYRGLVESQIDLVFRFSFDTVITYINDACCTFFGRPREELLGSSFLEFFPEAEYVAIVARFVDVRRNPASMMHILEVRDANGDQKWIQWSDHGITDENGEVVGLQAVGRDITPLIEVQQQLAQREETLSTIFANIPIMLLQVDGEGRYEYVNEYWVKMLGWDLESMRAHPDVLSELYPDAELRQTAMDNIVLADGTWNDVKTRARDGSLLDASWAAVRLSDGRVIGIGQVITHRVELEKQRLYARELELELEKERELREVKERFVSLVSHEFRTPLAVMNTSLDIVTRYQDRLSRESVNEKLVVIQEQIERMVSLMEDTLRFSKTAARKTPFRPELFSICDFCEHIIEVIRMADAGKHRIELACEDGDLKADPKLLDHVLTNVLSNAIKYSPEQSAVIVNVNKQVDAWMFSVKDQGIGIPQGDLPKLFTPFHRAENALDIPGTGLGLSIVKDYVELHGGQVLVESAVGKGTTFRFTVSSPSGSSAYSSV